MFSYCSSLSSIPAFNTPAVTNCFNMFFACYSLRVLPLFNTSKVTNLGGFLSNCVSLKDCPAFSAAANTTALTTTFTSCPNVSKIGIVGVNQNITISNLKLSAAALNEIYANLATVTGKTITVTGNWGAVSDDPTIATAKGWTVTG